MRVIHFLSAAVMVAVPLAAAPASAQQQYDSNDYIRQPIRFDKTFDQSLEGGCKYRVSVSGTVTPAANSQNQKAPEVTPKIAVSAEAVCPNQTSVKITDNVLGTGPLTWKQLEDSISSRSHVFTVENQHQCTYGAQFKLVNAQLQLNRFDHNCTAI